jgi:hypothetical protein
MATSGAMLAIALLAAGTAYAERPGADSDRQYAASATPAISNPPLAMMSSHHSRSTDPARSKAEIEAWHYNADYLFGLSRGTANSALLPAFKPFVFLVTIPLDLALLPIAAFGGLFG